MKSLRVGLLGGTFDPVHYGHLAMAETAIRRFKLQKVYFVTAVNPPHKSHKTHASFLDRHAMVALALVHRPKMVPSSLEYGRRGKSYSIDTVRQLKRDLGDRADVFFLIGMDAFLELPTWKDYHHLIEYCSFVVFARPGVKEQSLADRLPEDLLKKIFPVPKGQPVAVASSQRIYMIRDFSTQVSSTDVRKRIHRGMSLQRWVPRVVGEYISKAKLYIS